MIGNVVWICLMFVTGKTGRIQ